MRSQRRHGITVSLLIALCVSGSADAQTNIYDLPIREHLYPNGLRLLVLERPGDHRVAAKIFTDFGAMMEVPGMLGAAHFLEHLMFKGTTSLGSTDWEAERPHIEAIRTTEAELIEELNRERNPLRERGVFNDYAHARTSPRIEMLYDRIRQLGVEVAKFRDNGAMMRWYQAYGGERLTASTEQEYMKFDINLPASRVELFFRIEADRMRNTIFREFDQERMILVEQRLGDLNRPTTPFYEEMNATVGVIHPVFWPEGHASDFKNYTRSYERELYEHFFVPNNTTLVLIGGVSFDEMVPVVDHYFGWMERAPAPTRIRAIEPRPVAERRLIYRSDDLSPRLDIRYRIPGVGHPERPGLDVVGEILSMALREVLQTAEIGAEVNVNTRVVHETRFGVPATMNIEVIASDAGQLQAVERIVEETIATMVSEPATEARMQRARKRLRNEWFRTALDSDRLAFVVGHFQVMDRWQTLEQFLMAREQTINTDVMLLAARYFIPENRTVGIAVPNPGATHDVSGGGNAR
jgi:predicted Zn-dependent peptidase